MNIVFLDNVAPKPYNLNTLLTKPLGGTEATVIRVSEELKRLGHNVELARNYIEMEKPDCIVVLRDPVGLQELKMRFPLTKLYLWSHDLPSQALFPHIPSLRDTGTTIVCVSDWHRTQTLEVLSAGGAQPGDIKVKRVYNPIDDALVPDDTVVNPNKLVFFSSPHKGLDHALQMFEHLRRFNPDFTLTIANPGYLPSHPGLGDGSGVINVGALSHNDAIKHVREALCVFHLNHVFPETFGLVYAEANAVGTPCLTHPLGAVYETTYHPHELVNSRDVKQVVDRLLSWYRGERPRVRGKAEFRTSVVAKAWLKVLQ